MAKKHVHTDTTSLGVWELISVAHELLSLFDVPWNKNEGILCCGRCRGTRHSRRYHLISRVGCTMLHIMKYWVYFINDPWMFNVYDGLPCSYSNCIA